jgi:hypothetical protein
MVVTDEGIQTGSIQVIDRKLGNTFTPKVGDNMSGRMKFPAFKEVNVDILAMVSIDL